jgi:uncharacterized protein (TIGR02271 family)
MTTLVAVFDDAVRAESARAELQQLGVHDTDIHVARQDTSYASESRADRGESDEGSIGAFFRKLFGNDVSDDEQGLFSNAVRRGNAVVSVDVEEGSVDSAAAILTRNGALDVGEHHTVGTEAASLPPAMDASSRREQGQDELALPVVEEELQVGTRARQRGGVRVYTRVSSRPVEEHVTLREEQVRVARRPVDRAVTDADEARLAGEVIEVTTMAEEPVVKKEARVVEEVTIEKDVVEHDETIRDTVRRTDVEVEQLGTTDRPTSARKRDTTD